MQLILHPTETREQHRLRILIQDTDGASIAELDGEFGLSAGQDSQPGEMVSSAMVLNLTAVAVPTPGAYSVDVLIDGQHVRSIGFLARDEPIAPPDPGGN
jgi:hypothetical protein